MEKKITKNYFLNLIYQLLLVVIPVITTTYVSRVLKAEGIGLFSFVSSISCYFVFFAKSGTDTFGNREIGTEQNDVYKRSVLFWEIFCFRMITTLISICVYFFFLFYLDKNIAIYLTFSLNILNVALDITWFFQGIENFSIIVLLNSIIRLLGLIFIFLFVKNEEDLWLYCLITNGTLLFGSASSWIFIPRYLTKIDGIHPFRNFKSILNLFLPTIAIQIYTVLDKTMIGWFSSTSAENGYYDPAEKIARMATIIVTAMSVAVIPQIARLNKEVKLQELKETLYNSFSIVLVLGIPICIGLIIISESFISLFLGNDYEKSKFLLKIMSLLIIAIGLNNVSGVQYLISVHKEKVFTITVVIGAIVNFTLNLILIPRIYSIGAAISSVIAETVITIIQFIYIRTKDEIALFPILKKSIKPLLASVVMAIVIVVLMNIYEVDSWFKLALLVGTSAIIYFIVLILLKERLVWGILNTIFSKSEDR